MDAITDVPLPANEPVHEYAPHSPERTRLTERLKALAADPIDLPHVIGGTHRMGGGQRVDVVQPHRHPRGSAPSPTPSTPTPPPRSRRRSPPRPAGRPPRSTSVPPCSCAPLT